MASKTDLEARLRSHAESLDAEVGPRLGLEERLLRGAIATPPAPVRRMPLLREAAIAASVLLIGSAAGFAVIQLRASRQSTANNNVVSTLPARLSYTPSIALPAGPIEFGSARTGVTMKMFTPLRGWAVGPFAKGNVGPHDAVLVTADGGSHWRNVTPPGFSPQQYMVVPFFLDVSHAWVVLTPNRGGGPPVTVTITTFRTADGGASWQRGTVQMPNASPTALDFVDATHGWMMLASGSSQAIYGTTDAGSHWALVSRQPFVPIGQTRPAGTLPLDEDPTGTAPASCGYDPWVGIAFHDRSTGWAAGLCSGPALKPYFYVTHDAGRSWQAENIPSLPATTKCPCWTSGTAPVFTSAQDGSAVFTTSSLQTSCEVTPTGSSCGGTATPQHIFVLTTADGGRNWAWHQLPGVDGFGAGPTFADGHTGWFAAAIPMIGATHGELSFDRLYITRDGGANWSPLPTSANFQGGELDFVSPTTGWVLNGLALGLQTLLETKNGGRTWQQLHPVLVR